MTAGRTLAPDATEQTSSVGGHPHIRSFSGRRGHFTAGQRLAYQTLFERWTLPYRPAPIDASEVFGRSAPRVLEIGFGMGETTAAIAQRMPDTDFLGVEVYPAGVGALLRRIDEAGLSNLRIIQHDAVEVVRDMIAPGTLAGIHVFFPDPWPKKRHHKRRLIQPAFVALLASRLAPGGYLHCATDWAHYAVQMLAVLAGEPLLVNTAFDDMALDDTAVDDTTLDPAAVGDTAGTGATVIGETPAGCRGFAPRPAWRPVTKFENRGLRLGHGVWDVVFRRI